MFFGGGTLTNIQMSPKIVPEIFGVQTTRVRQLRTCSIYQNKDKNHSTTLGESSTPNLTLSMRSNESGLFRFELREMGKRNRLEHLILFMG